MTAPAWRRWLPLVALVAVAGGVYVSGLHHHLSMATLHGERVALERFVVDHPVIAPVIFVAIYAAATALSLPGALFLTLAGGFLFGVVLGGLWSVLGATAGAVVVFQIARSAFGAGWRQRAGPWLQRMEAGFREDAFAYLLVLRLIPLFPFWLVNLVPAFLGVSLRTFTLASILGMIPAAFVYASAGSGLNSILDRGDQPDLGLILEPKVLGPLLGLAVLVLLPVAYRRWKRH